LKRILDEITPKHANLVKQICDIEKIDYDKKNIIKKNGETDVEATINKIFMNKINCAEKALLSLDNNNL
jgi:hypothetical protein